MSALVDLVRVPMFTMTLRTRVGAEAVRYCNPMVDNDKCWFAERQEQVRVLDREVRARR
jgi:predicted metal-binding protein